MIVYDIHCIYIYTYIICFVQFTHICINALLTHNYNTYLNGIGDNYNICIYIYIFIYRDRYGCVQACVFLLNNHKLYDFVTPILSKSFWLCWEWLPGLCAEQWGSLCLDRTSLITLESLQALPSRKLAYPNWGRGNSSSQLPLDRIF